MGIKKIISGQTSGTNTGLVQAFQSNTFANINDDYVSPIAFNLPMFTTMGTYDYYGQSAYSIFTSVANPFIRFIFSANTSSFGPGTTLIHNIYRLDYQTFSNYITGLQVSQQNSTNNSTQVQTVTDSQGVSNRTTTVTNTTSNDNLSNPAIPLINLSDIQKLLNNPIVSFIAATTGITTDIYDLVFDEYTKPDNSFKTLLFQDRAQYFIDTVVQFAIQEDDTLLDFYVIDKNLNIKNLGYQSQQIVNSNTLKTTLNSSLFPGLNVAGSYFTYFVVPNVPNIEYPITTGIIDTLTPTIFYSNVEDSDSNLIQVTYDTGNTSFTASTFFSYPVAKTDANKQQATNTNSSFATTKVIRFANITLNSNSQFLYRVGNVKSMVNIFGVKQSICTFSNVFSGQTPSTPLVLYVGVESDSPFLSGSTGYITPPSLFVEVPETLFVLSGCVSGSVVSYATQQLIYPDLSYITQSTDSGGTFTFTNLGVGNYSLVTSYRGYKTDTRTISITGDTTLNYRISLLWSDNYDRWGDFPNEVPVYP